MSGLTKAIKAVLFPVSSAQPKMQNPNQPQYTWQYEHILAVSYNRFMPVVKYYIKDEVSKQQVMLEFNTESGKLVGVTHQKLVNNEELVLTRRQVDDSGQLSCEQFDVKGTSACHKSVYDAHGNILEDSFSSDKEKNYYDYVDEKLFLQVFANQMLSKSSEGEVGEIKKEALGYVEKNLAGFKSLTQPK